MKHSGLAAGVLVVVLAAGAACLPSSAPQASSESGPAGGKPGAAGTAYVLAQAPGESEPPSSIPDLTPQEPGWQQVNSSGFGIQQAVSALEAFNGYLYAGTTNEAGGAQIFRSQDGVTWAPASQPGFGIGHDIRPPSILDMAVFRERIYASTGLGDGPGQIWRSLNGLIWAPMVIHGFGDPDTVDITALAVYNDFIYAGVYNQIRGAQIWRSFSGDSNTWKQVAPQVPGAASARITGFAGFGGELYAAVESDAGVQIWRSSSGTSWTTIVSQGFSGDRMTSSGGMAEFAGSLYAGAGKDGGGAHIWRTADGATWVQVISPGFGDPHNQKVEMVFVFQGYLYASVKNTQTGIEIWRSADGTNWEQANPDGFGDSRNTGSNWSNAAAQFLGDLYVGTTNIVEGGELWRLSEQRSYLYLPLIASMSAPSTAEASARLEQSARIPLLMTLKEVSLREQSMDSRSSMSLRNLPVAQSKKIRLPRRQEQPLPNDRSLVQSTRLPRCEECSSHWQ